MICSVIVWDLSGSNRGGAPSRCAYIGHPVAVAKFIQQALP